jgi:two-component system response regulator
MTTDLPAGTPEVSTAALSLIPPSPRSVRVFHVNDSTDDQVVFQAACRKAGVPFDWHVADSAEKGISYLTTLVEQSKSVPVCWPDLILLDIVMPAVSGFEVLKFIRSSKELKHLPVIIFTGNVYPQNEQESLRLGADAFRLKPHRFGEAVVMAQELYQLLKQLTADRLGKSTPSALSSPPFPPPE